MLVYNPAVITSVLCGALSATIFLCGILTNSPLLILLSPLTILPIFAIGLSLGYRFSIYASTFAMILIGGMINSLWGALMIGLLQYIPVCLIVFMALRQRKVGKQVYWYPLWRMVIFLSILSVIKCLVDMGIYGDIVNDKAMMSHILAQTPALKAEDAVENLHKMLLYLPGFTSVGWIVILILNGVIAQSILSKFGKNLRPSYDIKDFHLLKYFVPMIAIILLASQFSPWPVFLINLSISLSWCVFLNGQALLYQGIRTYIEKYSALVWGSYILGLLLWPFVVAIGIARGISEFTLNRRQ